ncbi:MAG: hypothetical protein OXG68_11505 [Chloroflexi bacterium]|nr:hypothetical protein [Chloroflexota bacterium]
MSQNSEYASLGNGNEAPHNDLLENDLLDAIASEDEATGESIAAPARDVIACKIASIVDGMEKCHPKRSRTQHLSLKPVSAQNYSR